MATKKASVMVGKKKSATARARVTKGKGSVHINSVPLSEWGTLMERSIVQEPLTLISSVSSGLDIDVNVFGGGPMGQAVASRTAIARAIVDFAGDEKLRKDLIDYDNKILAGDSRQREPNKPGDSAPRARRQKSYR